MVARIIWCVSTSNVLENNSPSIFSAEADTMYYPNDDLGKRRQQRPSYPAVPRSGEYSSLKPSLHLRLPKLPSLSCLVEVPVLWTHRKLVYLALNLSSSHHQQRNRDPNLVANRLRKLLKLLFRRIHIYNRINLGRLIVQHHLLSLPTFLPLLCTKKVAGIRNPLQDRSQIRSVKLANRKYKAQTYLILLTVHLPQLLLKPLLLRPQRRLSSLVTCPNLLMDQCRQLEGGGEGEGGEREGV